MPLKPERVAENRQEERREHETDAWLHEAAAWLRKVADGKEASPPPNAARAAELLAAKVLFGTDHPDAKEACALAKRAHFHRQEAIFDALVKAGYWGKDENLDLLRYEIPIEFTEDAVAEAEAARLPRVRGIRSRL